MKYKNLLICIISAAMVAGCVFWPSMISSFQDKKMRDRVELDKVEDTSEILTDTLSIEEKLSLIIEAEDSDENIAVTNQSSEWGSAELDALKKVCINELKTLKKQGMFSKMDPDQDAMIFYQTTTTYLDTKNYARRLRVHSVIVQFTDRSLMLNIDDSSHKILAIEDVEGFGIRAANAGSIIKIWGKYLGLKDENIISKSNETYLVRYKSGTSNVCFLFVLYHKNILEEGELSIFPEKDYRKYGNAAK